MSPAEWSKLSPEEQRKRIGELNAFKLERLAAHREVVDSFLAIARADKDFELIASCEQNIAIGVWTRKGENVEALAIAHDCLQNVSLVDTDGMVRQFLATEIW